MTDKSVRLGALGRPEHLCFEGTQAGVGVCRSCKRAVALIRRLVCPICGSTRGVDETGQ